ANLWPKGDPERAELNFRYARARIRAEGLGEDLLTKALARLREAGRSESAAEAEIVLADRLWMRARPREAEERFESALELLGDSAASPARASVLSRFSGFLMADGQNAKAIRIGLEALRLAEELGLDELRAGALTTIG